MRFAQSLKIRLRLQRRRHKKVTFAALAVAVALVLAAVYLWPVEQLRLIDERRCSYLPGFLCKAPAPQLAPFDPLKQPPPPSLDAAPAPEAVPDVPKPNPDQPKIVHINSAYTGERAKRLALGHRFYEGVMKTIIKARPNKPKVGLYSKLGRFHSERFETDFKHHPLHLEDYLSLFFQLTEDELDSMVRLHRYVLENLPDTAPEGLYAGDGIVYVGGGKFNWLTLLLIRLLRESGCKLPVEILIPTLDEYDLELCLRVFPVMNARCIHLPTALFGDKNTLPPHLDFKGYQYKLLAILLSSFENVLLMDSDNFAAYAPDHLFEKSPFTTTGMVVWPDYWRRSTLPAFYEIAGVKLSTSKLLPRYFEGLGEYVPQLPVDGLNWATEVPYHERVGAIPDPSSESGQLMINKRTHMKAVLLAFYYNLYGPNYYYSMFSQGAQGEGDKETFLAAALVLEKLFYQVGHFLAALGNFRGNEFNGKGMGQFDPVEDYEWNRQKQELRSKVPADQYQQEMRTLTEPRMLFIHANFPKLEPWSLMQDHQTIDKDGTRWRLFGDGVKDRTGTDFELDVWQQMHKLLCELNLRLENYKDVDRKELCKEVRDQLAFLELTALT